MRKLRKMYVNIMDGEERDDEESKNGKQPIT